MANRFLSQIESEPQETVAQPEKPSNRFLSSTEGIEVPHAESLLKSGIRTALQPALGYAKRYTWPADVFKLLTDALSKEALRDLAENDPRLQGEGREVAEKARQETLEKYIPTQERVEQLLEEKTGIPLEAKNKIQKTGRLAGSAAGFRPGSAAQKTTAAISAPVLKESLELAGVPESVSEPVALLGSGVVPAPSFSKQLKPSGAPVRRFESLKKDTKVSPHRATVIKEKVEGDFRKISDQLLQKNKTYSALKEDNLFKEKVGSLFENVESLSKEVPGEFSTQELRDVFRKKYHQREMKGISPDEFEKNLRKEVKSTLKEIPIENMNAGQMVEQFRKNNKSLAELFEPGKSSAFNRAKREALLEYNRSIEDVISKKYPDTEFKKLFQFTNKRWTEINDIEKIEGFIGDIFENKINYEEAKKLFRKDSDVSKSLKRSIGDSGFDNFKSLTEELLSGEKAMAHIKKASDTGFKDFAKLAGHYTVSPATAKIHFLGKYGKKAYQMLLDKPELAVTWKNGLSELKKGNYEESYKYFSQLDQAINQTTQTNHPEKPQ